MSPSNEGRSQYAATHGGIVEIDLRDVYNEVRRIAEGYGELSGKLDTAMSMQAMRFDAVGRELASNTQQHTDYELRLRSLEQRPVVTPKAMWTAIGSLTGLVSVAIAIVALFVK